MNIIGLSGYMGSGKNLVCKIIQSLTAEDEWFKKETIKAVTEWDGNWNNISTWKQKAFAGKLKQIASLITGIPIEKFEDQEFKNSTLGEEWDFENEDASDNIMTARMFLQRLGTEAIRNNLHENAWVNSLMVDYKCVPADRAPNGLDCDNWIITDTRFPNEAKAIKDRGGIVVRVNRYIYPNNPVTSNLHPSETGLDSYSFDYIINNNSDINNLIEETKIFLKKFSII